MAGIAGMIGGVSPADIILRDTDKITNIAYDNSGRVVYVGKAAPGTSDYQLNNF